MLRAALFGGPRVEIGGLPLPALPGAKARSVLAYLLAHPGRHPRSRLAGVFWPDVMEASALASLRGALWTIRRALDEVGGAEYLEADRRTVGIASGLPRNVDLEVVAELARSEDPADLERVAVRADGPLLGELDDEWAIALRDEWRDRLAGILERLGDAAERAGDPAAAAEWARRALVHDRVRESAHRALIRRLAAQGRREGALAAYRACRATLMSELGVAPSAATRALAAGLTGETAGRAAAPGRAAGEVPALVGRGAELGALTRAWAEARAGRGGMALVIGPGGIGKTRLTEELAHLARRDGAVVASGGGLDLDGAPPFAPWSEVLRELVAAVPAPPGDRGWASEVARLSPAAEAAWGGHPSAPMASPDLERARLFEAVVAFVAWSAGRAPVLIVLEDLHQADAASLALLAYLGRRLPDLDALVVATRRETPAVAELDVALDGLRRRGALATEVRLGPLAPGEMRALVGATVPGLSGTDTDRAAALGEGNALLATAAARSIAAGDDPADGLRAGLRGPLARLPAAARTAVELTVCAGRPLTPAELAGPVGAESLDDAVAAGVAADILVIDRAGRIGPRHALVREACHAEIPATRRAALHARLAAALAARPGCEPAEVARHLRLAGDGAGAGRRLREAARTARRLGALEEAADYLREAAGLVAGDPAAEAELWLDLAGVEAWRGRRAAWEQAAARAEALLGGLADPRGLAEALVLRGRLLRTTLCYPREALEAYGRALELIDRTRLDAPELRALALAGSAWAEAMAGDPDRVEALAAEAEAVPETSGDLAMAAEIALSRAAALIRAGRMAEAEAPYERAAVLAEAAGRPDLAHVAWANIASAAACRGDFERALRLAERAAEGARLPGMEGAGPVLEAFVQAARAHALSRLGRHAEARAAAETAAALAARSGDPGQEARAEFDRGAVALAAGRPGPAAVHLAAALAGSARGVPRPLARLLLAEARLEAEGPDAAEAELGRVPFEPVAATDLPDTLVARMARVQARIALARGRPGPALRRLDEAERVWRRRLPSDTAGDLFSASLVDLGRPPVAGLVEPGVELGRTLADRAEALRALGRDADAAGAAAEALGLADRLRFDGYRERLAGTAGGGS